MSEEKEIMSKKKWYKKWWVWVIVLVIFYIIGNSQIEQKSNSQPINTQQGQKQNQNIVKTEDKPQQINQLGAEGFLRLSGIDDPEQIIILTEKKEDYDKVNKALMANDPMGLLEIASAFGVSNGTKIKLIDSGFGMRRVRILEGIRDVDSDKIGRSGWVPMEYVVNR